MDPPDFNAARSEPRFCPSSPATPTLLARRSTDDLKCEHQNAETGHPQQEEVPPRRLSLLAGLKASLQNGWQDSREPTRSSRSPIMDVPEPVSYWQRVAWQLLRSPHFDTSMGFIILVNSLLIGLEQHLDLEGHEVSGLVASEHVFLSIYLGELFLRFFVVGRGCLEDPWVCFDIVLVATGIATAWLLVPFLGLGSFMVFRLGRLLRLARAVRLLVQFRELWMLVRGLLNCMRTLLYTVLTIGGVLFVLTCVAVEVITKHHLVDSDPVFREVVQDHFQSFPATMLTLVRFVTLDNAVFVYEPLIERDPLVLGPYFLIVLLVVSIAMMNLVTAVIVNSALEQASSDREAMAYKDVQRKRQLVRQLRDIFVRLDNDASGTVSLTELVEIGEEDLHAISQCMAVADPVEVFRALDVDESGELDIKEFCDGIWQVMTSKAPLEVKSIQKSVAAMRAQLRAQDQTKKLEEIQRLLEGQSLHKPVPVSGDDIAPQISGKAKAEPSKQRSAWAQLNDRCFVVPTEAMLHKETFPERPSLRGATGSLREAAGTLSKSVEFATPRSETEQHPDEAGNHS